ncbi:MAG TPA: tRNA (guanosine(46)-N7)-methyltransferase TrmB [Chitinophagaceae bacterium]|nr:tRNA (guanosine(46)-N7)-methyltransferase TrmB [Chitinophagaceae bacterium]
MGQKKLIRFAQIKAFPHVFEYPENMAGQWHAFFKNNHPIVLELACGRGEYTVGMAGFYPDKNFIGVDVKGNRMYIGAKKTMDAGLSNAAFLRTQIEMLGQYFAPGEVNDIWITFPDPQLRTSKAKKRLTHPRFLRLYKSILAPGGCIHLKTDSPDLYRFSLLVADMYGLTVHDKSDDIYARPNIAPELHIKTHYESLDIAGSNRIHYLQLSLPGQIADKDEELYKILRETEQSGSSVVI